MVLLGLPTYLEDKIFELKFHPDGPLSKVVSYFPLSESEKQEIISNLDGDSFNGFHSIFTDRVSEEEWIRTKEQIKKKFQDELFNIDDV